MLAQINPELSFLFAISATILGACFGSFAGVIISRVPAGLSIVLPRSHCFSCRNQLKVWHNIPIFSWMFLRGRCAFCKASIGLRPLLVEVILALGFLALWVKFGFSVALVDRALFLFLLVCIAYIDIDTFYIPLSLLIALFIVGVLANAFYVANPSSFVAPGTPISFLELMVFKSPRYFSLTHKLAGAVVGFLVLALVNIFATLILRRRGRLMSDQWAMGFGDAVLLSAIGLFVGISHMMLVLFLASALGSVVGLLARFDKRRTTDAEIAEGALPYGPFLAIAAIYVYLF